MWPTPARTRQPVDSAVPPPPNGLPARPPARACPRTRDRECRAARETGTADKTHDSPAENTAGARPTRWPRPPPPMPAAVPTGIAPNRLAPDASQLVLADLVQMILKVDHVEEERHHTAQLQVEGLYRVVIVLQRILQAEEFAGGLL